jgi:hypothetical protein
MKMKMKSPATLLTFVAILLLVVITFLLNGKLEEPVDIDTKVNSSEDKNASSRFAVKNPIIPW